MSTDVYSSDQAGVKQLVVVSSIEDSRTVLTLKGQITTAADDNFFLSLFIYFIFFLFFRENKF